MSQLPDRSSSCVSNFLSISFSATTKIFLSGTPPPEKKVTVTKSKKVEIFPAKNFLFFFVVFGVFTCKQKKIFILKCMNKINYVSVYFAQQTNYIFTPSIDTNIHPIQN